MIMFSHGMKGVESKPVPGEEGKLTGNVLPSGTEMSYPLPAFPPMQDYIAFMKGELDSSGTVGAAYAMVGGGKVQYIETYGERKAGSGKPVDEHTLFRLASVSKGFAGALGALLEEEGIVNLDDRVAAHYPGFRLKDSRSTDSLSIRHLLSHTTGLVPYAFDNLVEAGEDLPDIADRLHEVDISGPPGTLYGYQNVMFSLWDPIVRRITGSPYEVLVEEMIFKPLGMEDASVGRILDTTGLNMASPHLRGRGGYFPLEAHTGYYNVLPAAGVNASISDMSRWLLALLGHSPEALPAGVRDKLTTPLIYTPLKYRYTRYWKPFRERYYSLGWRVYQYRGRKIVYHGGYIRGYRAEIGFCPAEDVGVVFLQNSPNSLASMSVPRFFDSWFDYVDGRQAGKAGEISE